MVLRRGLFFAGQMSQQNLKFALHATPHLNFAIYPLLRVIHAKSSERVTTAGSYNNFPSPFSAHSEPGKISAEFIDALSFKAGSAISRFASVGDLRLLTHSATKSSALEMPDSPTDQTYSIRVQKLPTYNALERIFIRSKKVHSFKQNSYLENQTFSFKHDGPMATSRYPVVKQLLRKNQRVEQQMLAPIDQHFRKTPPSQELQQLAPRQTTTPSEEIAERRGVTISSRDNWPQQVPQVNVDALANQVMRKINHRISTWRERTGKI